MQDKGFNELLLSLDQGSSGRGTLAMTKYCNDCHTANKDRAKYCCSCKGRFSGVRFGAHTSAGTFPDSLPAPRTPKQMRGRSAPTRTSLLVIFLLLLLGPLTYQEESRFLAQWSLVRNSVATAWQRSWASIAAPAPWRSAAARPSAAIAPAPAETPSPPDAARVAVAARAGETVVPAAIECTDARAALSLCAKEHAANRP